MQVSVEKTSELIRKMTVSIPGAVVREKMESRFKALAREVKVHGFRPGKVPANVIKKLYSDRVRNEVAGDLIQSSYTEALQQQNLVPAGRPQIQTADDNENFAYTAEFEVYPEISLNGVSQLRIKRPLATVSEGDVDNMIEKLRQQKKTWKEVERLSQSGDLVTLNYSGICEEENFTGGKVENQKIEVGSNTMIPGFEEELKGVATGVAKTFNISFPETYNNGKLAGKTAQFEIEVVKVEEPVLPDVDAEFVKAYGMDDEDLEAFRASVKDNMSRELEQGLKNKLKNNVLSELYEKVEIAIPGALIEQESLTLMRPYMEQAKKMHRKPEDLSLPRDVFENQARRRVALGLLLGEIIQQNNIKIDDARVRSVIENMASSYEKPEEVVSWYYSDNSRLNDVQQMVLEDQAIDWIVGEAQVSDELLSFSEVMDNQQVEA